MWFLTVRSLFVACLLLMVRTTVALTDGSEQTLSVDKPIGGRLFDYHKRMFMSPSNVYKTQRRERQIQIAAANDDPSAAQNDFRPAESWANRPAQPKSGGGQNCYFSPVQCVLYATPIHGRADGLTVFRVNQQELSRKRQTNRSKYALLQRWRTEGLASSGLRM